MEAIPKFDTKSVIKSDIKFDISTRQTTWTGHNAPIFSQNKSYKQKCEMYFHIIFLATTCLFKLEM